MPPTVAQRLYTHARSPRKKIVILPGHRHGEGFNEAREPYEKAAAAFLAGLAQGE
jgi:alpha-beta hydrolase superfamily lysophospholipase